MPLAGKDFQGDWGKDAGMFPRHEEASINVSSGRFYVVEQGQWAFAGVAMPNITPRAYRIGYWLALYSGDLLQLSWFLPEWHFALRQVASERRPRAT